MPTDPHLLLLAGETSGDLLGGELLQAIYKRYPNAKTAGMGGDRMKASGMEVLVDAKYMAIMGAWEVLTHVPRIIKAWLRLKNYLKKHKPTVVLIDYPGFNLRFAKLAHTLGCRVIYVVSPQVWAWKAGRLKTIKRVVGHMAVLFPFEKTIYDSLSIPCSLIRHPLIDKTKRSETSKQSYEALGLNPDTPTIALCPGSRQKEIKSLLPIMVDACHIILKTHPNAHFLLCLAPSLKDAELPRLPNNTHIINGADHHALSHAQLALVASGTMTLELALLEIPMVITYRLHPISFWLATKFVSTPWVGLCNILLQRTVAPECLQHEATAKTLADHCLYALTNPRVQTSHWTNLRRSLSGDSISTLVDVI